MKSRLRKVEHIVVFDTFDEMVAGEKSEPYWYKYQKEVFYGNKKIREINYDSRPKKVRVSKNQLSSLRKRVNKMINERPYIWHDVESQPEWLDVEIKGGSTISYMGEDKKKFLKKVLGVNEEVK